MNKSKSKKLKVKSRKSQNNFSEKNRN